MASLRQLCTIFTTSSESHGARIKTSTRPNYKRPRKYLTDAAKPVIGTSCHERVGGEPFKIHRGMVKSITFHKYSKQAGKTVEGVSAKEMEAEKRKNKENDVVSGPTPKKARDQEAGEMAVNDDEVDEFYAILRRIRAAVTYFEKSTGDGRRRVPTKVSTWREGLESKIMEEFKGAGSEKLKRAEDVEENMGFDLNVNPDSDEDAVTAHMDCI